MKVVLDTNVLIDGFRDDYSYEKQIIDEIRRGNLEAYANRETMRENKLIMHRLIENPQYTVELNEFFSQLNLVINRRNIRVVPDEEDNKILESAVEAKADYLITRDNDLLGFNNFQGVEIITPQAFWARYSDEGNDLWNRWADFMKS